MVMKKTIGLMLILSALSGCVRESGGIHKLEAFGDRFVESSRGGGVPVHAQPHADTVLYMTAVEFPEGYDWRRDTSRGDVRGRLVLFRDSLRILDFPAGAGCAASLDPDLHHFAGGHIYTESCTADETVIGRDGEVLFSYPGRELLCGLLVEGDDIYTLGRSRSGAGFSLRRNGEELFSRPDGGIAALFSSNPSYLSGALYRDHGHLYFSYWRPLDGDGDTRLWYVVEDGAESRVEVPDGRMYDIRIRDGAPVITPLKFSPLGVYSYYEGTWKDVVVVSRDGRLTVYSPLWPTYVGIDPLMLFLSFRNACLSGHRLYIAMNPIEEGGRPFLWRDGEIMYHIGVNGFVTEVSLVEETAADGDKDGGTVGIAADFHYF